MKTARPLCYHHYSLCLCCFDFCRNRQSVSVVLDQTCRKIRRYIWPLLVLIFELADAADFPACNLASSKILLLQLLLSPPFVAATCGSCQNSYWSSLHYKLLSPQPFDDQFTKTQLRIPSAYRMNNRDFPIITEAGAFA